MKNLFIISILLSIFISAQQKSGANQFWEKLQNLKGNAYEGELLTLEGNADFAGKKLVMHVRLVSDSLIKIPFFVGDDKSRTWVLTIKNDRILLKHDHRLTDGSEDPVTQYGGSSTNSGSPNLQFFPADQETCDLIAYAAANVWWITVDEKSFTYNLRRMGTDRLFSVKFDLTKKVETPSAPWGWKE